jgi:hypothetical protein
MLNIIRCVYGFTPTVKHVCNNQGAITATWKENTLSVFDKTKPGADVTMVARSAISELQQFTTVKAMWVSSHADTPPLLQARRAEHHELPDELKPRHDALHFHEQQISVVISHKKVTSRLPLHIANMIHGPALRTYTT